VVEGGPGEQMQDNVAMHKGPVVKKPEEEKWSDIT
jgi:hypothetical protein